MNAYSRQAIAKRQGRNAAKVWLASAATADKVMLYSTSGMEKTRLTIFVKLGSMCPRHLIPITRGDFSSRLRGMFLAKSIESCSICAGQRITCDCSGHGPKNAIWNGEWPDRFISKEKLREVSSYLELGQWRVADADGRNFNI